MNQEVIHSDRSPEFNQISLMMMDAMAACEERSAEHGVAVMLFDGGLELMASDGLDHHSLAQIFGALAQQHFMMAQEGSGNADESG